MQAVSEWLSSWASLIGDQGLISVELVGDVEACFPEAQLSDVWRVWKLAAGGPGRHVLQNLTPAAIMAAAAAVGLVPRPGTGRRFSR